MEVPFDKVGPGQSGRLVYQVMGDSGPIANPNRIRYLAPDSSELPESAMPPHPFGLQAGLSGASLVASVMNLSLSSYIAVGVAELRQKMNIIEGKIDHILGIVERIDTQVAENNLRHAMNHQLRRAVTADQIDLRGAAELSGDLDRFAESVPGSLFLNFSLAVSSDVRETVRQLCDLLSGIRAVVAQSYNIAIKGDPERVIGVDPSRDYFRHSHGGDLDTLVKATTVLQQSVYFTSKIFDTGEYNQYKEMELSDLDDYLPAHHSELCNAMEGEEIDRDNIRLKQQHLSRIVHAWLYRSDAGLFYRTGQEMLGLVDGYEKVFWPHLNDSEILDLPDIYVSCELPSR